MKTCTCCGESKPETEYYTTAIRCKSCISERARVGYAADPEKYKRRHAEWMGLNREKKRAHDRAAHHRTYVPKPRVVRPKKLKLRKIERFAGPKEPKTFEYKLRQNWYWFFIFLQIWQATVKESRRLHDRQKRRLRDLKLSHIGRHTKADIDSRYLRQHGRCAICLMPFGQYEVDHILPLALGGDNSAENIQLLCRGCNCAKGAMHPEAFMRLRGLMA